MVMGGASLAASRAEDQRWTRAQSTGQGLGPYGDFETAWGVGEHHVLRRPTVRAGSRASQAGRVGPGPRTPRGLPAQSHTRDRLRMCALQGLLG